MVFHGFFMICHGFSWFQVGFSWFFMVFYGFSCFFMVPGWFFMVFLQNVSDGTVSWPDDPVLVRRPEGGIGPSLDKFTNQHHHVIIVSQYC